MLGCNIAYSLFLLDIYGLIEALLSDKISMLAYYNKYIYVI